MIFAALDRRARMDALSDSTDNRPALQLEAPSAYDVPEPVEVTWEDEQEAIRFVEIQL